MRAKGDGNCLPHAVSLSLWGHGDDTLVSGVFIVLCGEGMGNAHLLFVSDGRPFDCAHLPRDKRSWHLSSLYSASLPSLVMSWHGFLCQEASCGPTSV